MGLFVWDLSSTPIFWGLCVNHSELFINHSWLFKKLFIEGSLEVKLPTIWTDEKQSRAEAERRERSEERRVEEKE